MKAGGSESAALRAQTCRCPHHHVRFFLTARPIHPSQLLDQSIARHADFVATFGAAAATTRYQCAEVKRSQNRRWLRLLGLRHDVQVRATAQDLPRIFSSHSQCAVQLRCCSSDEATGPFRTSISYRLRHGADLDPRRSHAISTPSGAHQRDAESVAAPGAGAAQGKRAIVDGPRAFPRRRAGYGLRCADMAGVGRLRR